MAVVALAGRRIDAPGADPARFPLENVAEVRERIRALLLEQRAQGLACSAACGADLLALEAAESLGLRRRVVLPFPPERFREGSVIDRPGEWGAVFDRLVAALEGTDDLIVLDDHDVQGDAVYTAANHAILRAALELAREPGGAASAPPAGAERAEVLAVIVWEGRPRGDDDVTAQFAAAARGMGLPVREVLTT